MGNCTMKTSRYATICWLVIPTDSGILLCIVLKDGQMERTICIIGPTARKFVMECQKRTVIRRTMTGNLANWYPNDDRASTGNGAWVLAPVYPLRVIGIPMTTDPRTIAKIASRLREL